MADGIFDSIVDWVDNWGDVAADDSRLKAMQENA